MFEEVNRGKRRNLWNSLTIENENGEAITVPVEIRVETDPLFAGISGIKKLKINGETIRCPIRRTYLDAGETLILRLKGTAEIVHD